jgi:hypothetical protein
MGNLDFWPDLQVCYNAVYADVQGGTTKYTLYKPYRWMYVGPPDIRYFLEYPLVNT